MDFALDKKHEMARTLFREFAEKEVKPLAQEVDETEVFPRATVEKMAKYGFLGIPVPKEYGGQGCDPLTYAMCVEELAKGLRHNRSYRICPHISVYRSDYDLRHGSSETEICSLPCKR